MLLQHLQNHKFRIAATLVLVLLLVLIRVYEDQLFYDPFLLYFKTDYFNSPLPEINGVKLFFGLFSRYFLNTSLSLAIIYVLFKDTKALQFSIFLYAVFFVILVIALYVMIYCLEETHKIALFYVRRFLIQPLFLLLFLPAFYFQLQNTKNM
jgi:exosortase F-associated protein